MKRSWVAPLMAIALGAAIAGCADLTRLNAVPASAEKDQVTVAGMSGIRYWGDEVSDDLRRDAIDAFQREEVAYRASGHQGPPPPVDYLAISGGGENGAFGAGLLVRWTAAGDRPSFKLVTGISTGALIAPFAFL